MADVVFANSVCFSSELMEAIADRATLLKPGSLVITATHRLEHEALELIASSKQTLSWGDMTFFIHRRVYVCMCCAVV